MLLENDSIDGEEMWRAVLSEYAKKVSDHKWVCRPYLEYIADEIEEGIKEGGGRYIINIPSQYGKSELLSHWLPTWFLDWNPDKNVILSSRGSDLAVKYSGIVRDELEHNEKTLTKPKLGRKKVKEWYTEEGGGMKGTGLKSQTMGFPAHLYIIDDPYLDLEEALNPEAREKVQNWFQGTVYSRLDPNATVIVIMQRFHEDDLSGWLQKEHADEWKTISLPVLAGEDDPLGRAPGEPLYAPRHDAERLEKIKQAVGPTAWAAMWMQNPQTLGETIFERDWLRYWTDLPEYFDTIALSVDTSFKKRGKSYAVVQAWGKIGNDRYLLDQWRQRAGAVATEKAILKMIDRHDPDKVYIEGAANGIAILDRFEKRFGDNDYGEPFIEEIKPTGSKEARAYAVENQLYNGNVHFPHPDLVSWGKALVQEIVRFPKCDNNDQVDAMTQILNKWQMTVEDYEMDFV